MNTLPDWASNYIGLDFESKGRGPDKFDCWGLVMSIYYKQFNIILPSYIDKYTDAGNEKDLGKLILSEKSNWIEVALGFEVLGDVIVLRMKREPMHVGLILARYSFIHVHSGIGSVVQRYDGVVWENRVIGIYRHVRMINVK